MNSEPECMLAYITAGAGGMLCGSCLHDNTLARTWCQQGIPVVLVPTYTPIRTDEEDVSSDRVFLGGINVYLQQRLPWLRHFPAGLLRWLDHPRLIRWATSRAAAISASSLGALTVSMLQGVAGHQRHEVLKLTRWLTESLRPRLVLFTNMLIAGCAEQLRSTLQAPILVTLQGDDVFLDSLVEPYRTQALQEICRLIPCVDAFLVHSQFYADFMQDYLGIPADKIRLVPLGIDTTGFPPPSQSDATGSPGAEPGLRTIGYLARLAPEKGLHVLVDAFLDLRRRESMDHVQLKIAGWLGPDQREFAQTQFRKLDQAGLNRAWQYLGTVDRAGKLSFLQNLHVLSVPTTYREPKGLYVLEALAAGVPVVQPAHGAFPEMLSKSGGGLLVPPHDSRRLADAWQNLLTDEAARRSLGQQGALAVHGRFHAQAMARKTWAVCQEFLR